jgi:hypothetical protein
MLGFMGPDSRLPPLSHDLARPPSPSQWSRILAPLGWLLLLLWGLWWGASLARNQLVLGTHTSVPYPTYFLGLDFTENYLASRSWLQGNNPNRGYTHWNGKTTYYIYPPPVLPLFSWCAFTSLRTAYAIWLGTLLVITVAGTHLALRVRSRLGLTSIPGSFALATILFSLPFLYEMERGNCNLLVLPFILAGCWALHKETTSGDIVAGACLALGTWVKLYPGLVLIGLLGLRRPKAVSTFVLVAGVIFLVCLPVLPDFLHAIEAVHAEFSGPAPWAHSLGDGWDRLAKLLGPAGLSWLPKETLWLLTVFPLVLLLSWRMFRTQEKRLAYPYLLWLIAAGTYLPRLASDYSLVFLPLCALAVWDRKDGAVAYLGLVVLVVSLQPLVFLTSGWALLLKYLSLLAVGYWLLRQIAAAERNQSGNQIGPASQRAPEWQAA